MKTWVMVLIIVILISAPVLYAASDTTIDELMQEVTAIKNTLIILIGVHDRNVDIYNDRFDKLEKRMDNVERYLRQGKERA